MFVSYKSQDRERVRALVEALKAKSYSLWWDDRLVGGEDWADRVRAELAAAKCVVVVWTARSLQSPWVGEEASEGARRSSLVPVILDDVDPPDNLKHVQTVRLNQWNGSVTDAAFLRLCSAIDAKLKRAAQRRLWRTGGAAAAGLAAVALVASLAQERVCAASWPQPELSDACGALGLGHQPTRQERLAWTELPAGDCKALRSFIQRFPGGAKRAEAQSRLDMSRQAPGPVQRTERDTRLPIHGSETRQAEPSEARARDGALAIAQRLAERRCDAWAQGQQGARLLGTTIEPHTESWRCTRYADGLRCNFDGMAVCRTEVEVVSAIERCGP